MTPNQERLQELIDATERIWQDYRNEDVDTSPTLGENIAAIRRIAKQLADMVSPYATAREAAAALSRAAMESLTAPASVSVPDIHAIRDTPHDLLDLIDQLPGWMSADLNAVRKSDHAPYYNLVLKATNGGTTFLSLKGKRETVVRVLAEYVASTTEGTPHESKN